jgi:integrase/recombinase XerD
MMTTSDLPSCAEPHLDSFEQSFAAANYTRGTLKNYRSLVRRLGRLLDAEGIRPATLTPDLADRVAREALVGSKSTIRFHTSPGGSRST